MRMRIINHSATEPVMLPRLELIRHPLERV